MAADRPERNVFFPYPDCTSLPLTLSYVWLLLVQFLIIPALCCPRDLKELLLVWSYIHPEPS